MVPRMTLLLALGVLTAAALACAGEAHPTTPPVANQKDENTKEPPRIAIGEPLTAGEAFILDVINKAFGPSGRPGLAGRKAESFSPRQAVLTGILKNLDMARAERQEEVVRLAREEARALFDPVISASFRKDYQVSFDRERIGRSHKNATVAVGGENLLILSPEAQEQSNIFALVFRNPRPDHYKRENIDASSENPLHNPDTYNWNLSVDQQLPWGPTITVAGLSTRRETHDELSSEVGAPWTTSLNATLVMPIPMSKDWGLYAPADVTLRQANYQRDRSYWDTKTIINATMRVIDNAYWDLAGSAENLRAAVQNRQILERLAGVMKKLVDAGNATEYSMQQLQAELFSVKELEESAWGVYLQTSNSLINLLDHNPTTVFIPQGYSKTLYERLPLNTQDAQKIGLEQRSELQAEKISLKVSNLLVKFQQNQTKPDFKFTFKFEHNQIGSAFGYQDWWDTIRNLPNQDARIQTYAFNYTRPVQNRAFIGAHKMARAEAAQQSITVEQTINQIEQEVGNALIQFLAKRRQVELAAENIKQAREQFKLAGADFEGNRLTVFEIVSKSREELFADLSYTAASMEYKKAESRLLSAEGILPFLYADMTAHNALERQRIGVLDAAKCLHFFGRAPAEAQPKPSPVQAPK